jgi:hypothetical protein
LHRVAGAAVLAVKLARIGEIPLKPVNETVQAVSDSGLAGARIAFRELEGGRRNLPRKRDFAADKTSDPEAVKDGSGVGAHFRARQCVHKQKPVLSSARPAARGRGLRSFTDGVSEDDLRVIAKHGYEGALSTDHEQQAQAVSRFITDALAARLDR